MSLNEQTVKRRRRKLITYSNADSTISDQFRAIRTNLTFIPGEKKKRTILITSPDKGNGKSTIIANLAVSLTQKNEKILLIDANLRNPVLHQMFMTSNTKGLTELLTNQATFEEVVYQTEIGKLDLLTSGTVFVNPSELLESEQMKQFLESIAPTYHMILIDSPPILKATETRVLANQCDGVVLVIHRRKTKIAKLIESRKLLELVDATLIGAIMNEK